MFDFLHLPVIKNKKFFHIRAQGIKYYYCSKYEVIWTNPSKPKKFPRASRKKQVANP